MSPSALHTSVFGPAFSIIKPLVQRLRPHLDQYGRHNTRHTSKQDQATTKTLEWLLRCREEVWTEPMARLTDAVSNSKSAAFLLLVRVRVLSPS
jgi:hypothetical protein